MVRLGNNINFDIKGYDKKGTIGSVIDTFLYDEDYLSTLNNLHSRAIEYEKMQADPMIKGMLRAQANPILRASWKIGYQDDSIILDETQKKILEYSNIVWFEDVDLLGSKLNEILSFIPYGFAYFEIVPTRKKSLLIGDYISLRMPIRLQKSIADFVLNDPVRRDKVTHIHQTTFNHRAIEAMIPVDNLMMFVFDQIGNDPTGRSMLRAAYKPWIQKDLIEKLQMIGIEKLALGTPMIDLPESYSPEDMEEAKKVLESYMGHEKAGIINPPGFKFSILEGKFKSDAINQAINQKNTEMVISFLAQFLLLGQFENGGAYALSQDQSDFFLNSLEYIAQNIASVLDKTMKQFIIMQFGPQETYPVFQVKGINSKASKEFADTLGILSEKGLITPDKRIESFLRDVYKVPQSVEETIEETPDTEQTETPDIQEGKEDVKEVEKEETETIEKVEDDEKQMTAKVDSVTLADIRFKDAVFVRGITENEKQLDKVFNDKYIPETETLEEKIQDILTKGYSKAKTNTKGGDEFLASSGNAGVKNDMKQKVKDQFGKYKRRLLSDQFAGKLMTQSLKNAELVNKEYYSVQLAFVSKGQFNSFKAGHTSNMVGVFFNEERRILENLEANFGSELSLKTILDQIPFIKLNRNILKLSVVTHPRALFKQEVLSNAQSKGINQFKMVVPKGRKFDAAGTTIASVFLIKSLFDWEAKLDGTQNGSGVVGGLGLHHNSVEYFEPIADSELKEAQALSREQRKNIDALKKA